MGVMRDCPGNRPATPGPSMRALCASHTSPSPDKQRAPPMPPLHALRIPQSVQAAGVLALHLRGLPLLRERPAEQNEHATTLSIALARGHARSAQRLHARADSRSAPTRRCLAALTLSVASASAPCCRSWIKTSKLSEAAAHITGVFPSCGQRGAAPAHARCLSKRLAQRRAHPTARRPAFGSSCLPNSQAP